MVATSGNWAADVLDWEKEQAHLRSERRQRIYSEAKGAAKYTVDKAGGAAKFLLTGLGKGILAAGRGYIELVKAYGEEDPAVIDAYTRRRIALAEIEDRRRAREEGAIPTQGESRDEQSGTQLTPSADRGYSPLSSAPVIPGAPGYDAGAVAKKVEAIEQRQPQQSINYSKLDNLAEKAFEEREERETYAGQKIDLLTRMFNWIDGRERKFARALGQAGLTEEQYADNLNARREESYNAMLEAEKQYYIARQEKYNASKKNRFTQKGTENVREKGKKYDKLRAEVNRFSDKLIGDCSDAYLLRKAQLRTENSPIKDEDFVGYPGYDEFNGLLIDNGVECEDFDSEHLLDERDLARVRALETAKQAKPAQAENDIPQGTFYSNIATDLTDVSPVEYVRDKPQDGDKVYAANSADNFIYSGSKLKQDSKLEQTVTSKPSAEGLAGVVSDASQIGSGINSYKPYAEPAHLGYKGTGFGEVFGGAEQGQGYSDIESSLVNPATAYVVDLGVLLDANPSDGKVIAPHLNSDYQDSAEPCDIVQPVAEPANKIKGYDKEEFGSYVDAWKSIWEQIEAERRAAAEIEKLTADSKIKPYFTQEDVDAVNAEFKGVYGDNIRDYFSRNAIADRIGKEVISDLNS